MSDKIQRIRTVQAWVVSADASEDTEERHVDADNAVYTALGLASDYPDDVEVRALIKEVAEFIPRNMRHDRWYA